jgi:serine/threonine-protein kinase
MAAPEKIGKYIVGERIGAGGCGVVYRARDPHIQRDVAIKMCISKDDQLRQRFFREAQVIGSLDHPAIISIFDFGFEDSSPFIVEELLSGEDLAAMIRQRREISLTLKLDYLIQIAGALLFAQRAGVLHRDIKPSNVQVLENGRVKLMDFGIAKILEQDDSRLTRKGALVGTMGYMAPEQIQGQEEDGRADIFSFGALAYELLTYKRPFRAEDAGRMIRAVLHDWPQPVSENCPQCSPALERLIHRCLEKNRELRYQDFEELLGELKTIREETAETVVFEEGMPGLEATGSEPAPKEIPLAAEAGDAGQVSDFELRRAAGDEAALSAGYAAAAARPRGRLGLVAVIALTVLIALAFWLGRDRLLGRGDGPAADSASPQEAPAAPFAATLEVLSTPAGAVVWMNGENLGLTTPAQVPLTGLPGEATQVELRRGDEILASQEFTLGPELPERWEPALPPPAQSFEITSKPEGARILFDGQPTGKVTPAAFELDGQSRHDLRLELEGHEPTGLSFALAELTAEQLERRRLHFPLKPVIPPGILLVEAPYPLRLQVAGRTLDITGRREISLSPGSHAVRLSATSVFYSDRSSVDIRSGQRTPLPLPEAVEIRVMANPSRCQLSIDGREVDWLPTDVRLVVGVHEFEFLWESLGRSQTLTREIQPDSERLFASADDPE